MRHRSREHKLGRSVEHRAALMAAMTCALVERKRITTTLAKAKEVRIFAEKLITLVKPATLAARRIAVSRIRSVQHVKQLIDQVVPSMKDRPGGYTRIIKVDRRKGDGAQMAILELVGIALPEKKKKEAAAEPKK
jgi:large subunit ribosomal protein L17